jgi:hypothetical protein
MFGAKLNMLRESHENALIFFKQNIINSEVIDAYDQPLPDSPFIIQTFGLFIKRLDWLNKTFLRHVRDPSFKSSENARRMLNLLITNQRELGKLLEQRIHRYTISRAVVNSFCQMHFDFSNNLLSTPDIRPLIETHCDDNSNPLINLAYELANITIAFSQCEVAEIEMELKIKLISLMPITVCLLDKYDWSRETQLPGSDAFWSLMVVRWMPQGFSLISMICKKCTELGIFCGTFLRHICVLLLGTLESRLVGGKSVKVLSSFLVDDKKSYSCLGELITEDFLAAVVDLVISYDVSIAGKRVGAETFKNDVYPLLQLIFKVFRAVSLNTANGYVLFVDFYARLFRVKAVELKSLDLWREHVECIIDKMWRFHKRVMAVEARFLDEIVVERVWVSTIELASGLIDVYFERFETRQDDERLKYLGVMREEVLSGLSEDWMVRLVRGSGSFRRVLEYYLD